MRTAKSLITLSLLALPWLARGQIIVGSGQIDLNARVVGTYNSNLNMSRDNQADYFATLNPTITYTRSSAYLNNSISLGVIADRYQEYTRYNRNSFTGSASSRLPLEKFGDFTAGLTAGYYENYVNDYSLNKRILEKTGNLAFDASLYPSARTEVDANSNYTRTLSSGFSTQDALTSSLGFQLKQIVENIFFYSTIQDARFTSSGVNDAGVKIDQYSDTFIAGLGNKFVNEITVRIGGGYTILHRSAAEAAYGSRNQGSSVIQASVDGPFLPKRYFPKTSSSFSIAYAKSQTAGLYDSGGKTLTGAVNLSWQARENTSLSLYATRSRSIAINDQTLLRSTVGAGVHETLSNGLSLQATTGYYWNRFSNHQSSMGQQQGLTASLQADYSLGDGKHWTLSSNYTYQNAERISGFVGYEQHIVWLSVNYKY